MFETKMFEYNDDVSFTMPIRLKWLNNLVFFRYILFRFIVTNSSYISILCIR